MIELASVIKDLRAELQKAIEAGKNEALRFELGPIELEVSVAIEAGAQAGASVRFWVVELGSQGTIDRTSTQQIKLTLQPSLGKDGTVPYVSGQAGERER
jgi:dUTPase